MGQKCACSLAKAEDTSRSKIDSEEGGLDEFKAQVKEKYKSRKEFGSALTGSDESTEISRKDFVAYVEKALPTLDGERLFSQLDTGGQGSIPKAEVLKCYQETSSKGKPAKSVSNDEVDRKKTNAFSNGKKQGLQHFKDFMKEKYKDPKEAFAKLDVDGDQGVEWAEFEKLLSDCGYHGDAKVVFNELDRDQDSSVTWKEFKESLGIQAKAKKGEKSVKKRQ